MSVWYLEDVSKRAKPKQVCIFLFFCERMENVRATVVEIVVGIQSLQVLWLGKPSHPSIAHRPFRGTDTCRKNIYS